MSPSDSITGRSSGRRRALVAICLLALLAPFGLTFAKLWGSTSDALDFARAERDGVAYLRPLVVLIADTADAQSAAIAGGQTDPARLRDAQAAVAAVDKRLGGQLSTTRRWAEVSSRIDTVATEAPGSAPTAYAAYTQLVDLELALAATVGDSSNLILDPELDSYYLMDATLLRVPALLVSAGRVSDLATLNGTDPVSIEVTRAQIRSAATAMDDGLRKSFASTRSRTLGSGMLAQIDRLRVATAALAPSSQDVGTANPTRTAATERAARLQVRDAALALESAGLDQLDQLLVVRVNAQQSDRTLVLGATLGGVALALIAWWALGSRRRATADLDDLDDLGDDGPADSGGSRDSGSDALEADPTLFEARDLLDAQRLVRVGRAVSARREKP